MGHRPAAVSDLASNLMGLVTAQTHLHKNSACYLCSDTSNVVLKYPWDSD